MSMNIAPHIPQVVVNASAPATEALAKANAMKEVVPATVQTEAIVPQKSREQEARAPINNGNSNTYEGIQNNNNIDNKVIPEDEQQSGEQNQNPEQQENEAQANDESQVEQDEGRDEQERSESKESAEQQQQEAEEQRVISQLESRDREVRAHEQAHAAVGGSLAGAPSYEFQTGPDGKKYAVGGEVSIDVSKTNDPETTIRKMQTVRAAALAPAEPSSQDRKVAAEASRNIADARAEMITESSSLKSPDEVDTSPTLNVESEEESKPSTQLQAEEPYGAPTERQERYEEPAQYPGKMNLAREYVAADNNDKTAQVVSQRYASSFLQKENYFNAVA